MNLGKAIEVLAREKATNDFAMSLVSQYRDRGTLSEKQQHWAFKLAAEAVAAAKVEVMPDFHEMWAALPAKGGLRYASPTGGFEIDVRRPRNGKDVLYVKVGSAYAGAIEPSGVFRPSREFGQLAGDRFDEFVAAMRDLAADPVGCLEAYGKATGNCGVCGRLLTDPVSIANGIGPVCLSRF